MRELWVLIAAILFLTSCEEVIDIDLNTADPRYVIEGDILHGREVQRIRVTQTASFDHDQPSHPVDHATVIVTSSDGVAYPFHSVGQGYYQIDRFTPRESVNYTLSVRVDGEEFTATERLHDYVNVDSVGVVEETVFNELHYTILFKFDDPKGVDNYYKYAVSVNGGPFQFSEVHNDKYNDGRYVTHHLMNYTNPYALGDTVLVRRQSISKDVFRYWNEFQLTNPGSAAPANPKSNISNGALGYFSVSRFKEYGFRIRRVDQGIDANE